MGLSHGILPEKNHGRREPSKQTVPLLDSSSLQTEAQSHQPPFPLRVHVYILSTVLRNSPNMKQPLIVRSITHHKLYFLSQFVVQVNTASYGTDRAWILRRFFPPVARWINIHGVALEMAYGHTTKYQSAFSVAFFIGKTARGARDHVYMSTRLSHYIQNEPSLKSEWLIVSNLQITAHTHSWTRFSQTISLR